MYTKIKTNEGNVLTFLTQQYEIGTYCIINNDPSQQFGVDKKEDIFHKEIRIKCIKSGDKLIGGSTLELKSKFPINKFETE